MQCIEHDKLLFDLAAIFVHLESNQIDLISQDFNTNFEIMMFYIEQIIHKLILTALKSSYGQRIFG